MEIERGELWAFKMKKLPFWHKRVFLFAQIAENLPVPTEDVRKAFRKKELNQSEKPHRVSVSDWGHATCKAEEAIIVSLTFPLNQSKVWSLKTHQSLVHIWTPSAVTANHAQVHKSIRLARAPLDRLFRHRPFRSLRLEGIKLSAKQ